MLVNKPAGIVTTRSDPERRRTVLEMPSPDLRVPLPRRPSRLRLGRPAAAHQRRRAGGAADAPAARGAEGLPRPRPRRPDQRASSASPGIPLDGHRTAPASVRVLKRPTRRAARTRSSTSPCVKAATGRCGGCARRSAIRSSTLSRVQFGPLRDPGLKVGHSRELTPRDERGSAGVHDADAAGRPGAWVRRRAGGRPERGHRRRRSSLRSRRPGRGYGAPRSPDYTPEADQIPDLA